MRDPSRADLVAALGETTGSTALERIRARMLADEVGREILDEKPVVSRDVRPDMLRTLPQVTVPMISSAYDNA